jgi:copper chaperone CopZ
MRRACVAAILCLVAALAAADAADLKLMGVHCPKGGAVVEKALKEVPGVLEVKLDIDKALAVVHYDPAKTKPEALVAAVNATGYQAELAKAGSGSHACPTTGDGPVDAFHAVLHRMHEGVNDGATDAVARNMADMKARRDALVKHCMARGGDMAELAEAVSVDVDALAKAAEGGGRERIEKAFNTLHDDFYKILGKLGEK